MVAMEERRMSLVLLLGLNMCLYIFVKHGVDFQAMFLQGEWEKVAMLGLVYESMWHIERTYSSLKNGCLDV